MAEAATIFSLPPVNFFPGELEVFRAPERVSTFDWARRNLRMVSGPYKGLLWKPLHTPYARDIMNAFDREHVEELFILGGSQGTGKTTIAQACILATLARKVFPAGLGMATQDQSERIFEERLVPYLRRTPGLKEKLSQGRYAIQKSEIEFYDGTKFYGMWSGSDASYSSVSMKLLHVSEEDSFEDPSVPDKMAERSEAYRELGGVKIIRESKLRGYLGESSILRAARARCGSSVYHWQARCPGCGTIQQMEFEHIKAFDENGKPCLDPVRIKTDNLARYVCPHCKYQWTDAIKNKALRDGQMPDAFYADRSPSLAFIIRGWETISGKMSIILAERMQAEGDPDAMKNWANNRACEEYEHVVREASEDGIKIMIAAGREMDEEGQKVTGLFPPLPAREVPAQAVALTAGIDVQLREFWFVVRAWSRACESWLVDYGRMPKDWDALYALVFNTTYPVQGLQAEMPIWRAGIDIGGAGETEEQVGGASISQTDQTLAWLQEVSHLGVVYGVKGASRSQAVKVKQTVWGSDRETRAKYRKFHGQLVGFTLDANKLKSLFFERMRPEALQPAWLNEEVRDDYTKQVTAEVLKRTRSGRQYWMPKFKGVDNHLLDCEIYAHACADPMWSPALHLLSDPIVREVRPLSASMPVSSGVSGLRGLAGRRVNPWAR